MAGFWSCALLQDPSPKNETQIHHASRRAAYGKYIVTENHVAGSRKMFIQPGGINCLNSSIAVSTYLEENLHEKNRDVVLIIFLDSKNRVLKMDELDPKFLVDSKVYSSLVTQEAIEVTATSVILVQCLPTRTSTPYNNDREISKNLKSALASIQVNLLDHLIVGRYKCYSFADNNLL